MTKRFDDALKTIKAGMNRIEAHMAETIKIEETHLQDAVRALVAYWEGKQIYWEDLLSDPDAYWPCVDEDVAAVLALLYLVEINDDIDDDGIIRRLPSAESIIEKARQMLSYNDLVARAACEIPGYAVMKAADAACAWVHEKYGEAAADELESYLCQPVNIQEGEKQFREISIARFKRDRGG